MICSLTASSAFGSKRCNKKSMLTAEHMDVRGGTESRSYLPKLMSSCPKWTISAALELDEANIPSPVHRTRIACIREQRMVNHNSNSHVPASPFAAMPSNSVKEVRPARSLPEIGAVLVQSKVRDLEIENREIRLAAETTERENAILRDQIADMQRHITWAQYSAEFLAEMRAKDFEAQIQTQKEKLEEWKQCADSLSSTKHLQRDKLYKAAEEVNELRKMYAVQQGFAREAIEELSLDEPFMELELFKAEISQAQSKVKLLERELQAPKSPLTTEIGAFQRQHASDISKIQNVMKLPELSPAARKAFLTTEIAQR